MTQPTWHDLPKEIQEEMLNEQERQGNKRDSGVFIERINAAKRHGGFNWEDDLWHQVINLGNFAPFYEKFPKKAPDTIAWDEPVEMLVWDDREENAKSRMVHGKFKGRFVVFDKIYREYCVYKNAKPILPTINWDEFKEGDVVEVMTITDRKYLGFYKVKKSKPKEIFISYSDTFFSCVILLKSNIKSIRKLK